MKLIKPIAWLLVFCVFTNKIFCQTNTILNYLPTDAKTIIKINPASLGQKIKWDELMKYKMFEDLLRKTPEQGKEFLNNPSHTGIDLSKGFFVVIPANKNDKKPQPVFFAIPKDTAQVALMMSKLNPERKIVKLGNGKLMIDNNIATAWNHDVLVITGYDSTAKTVNDTKGQLSADAMKVKQLTEKCKSLLTKRQAAFSNEQFLSLLSEQGDLLFWTDNTMQSQSQKNNKAMDALAMMNKGLMRKGNYTSGIMNFENGKVVANMKQHLPASLDSIYKKYPLKKLNASLVQKLPTGHPIVLCSFSISPEMLRDNLATSGAGKMLDSMSKQKTRIEDLLPAIKGDLTMAVLKTDDVAAEDSFTKNMNGFQVFIAGTINDKEKFKNLTNLINSKKQDSGTNAKKPKPSILSNDSIFVLSLSPIAAQKFMASAGTNAEMGKLIEPYKNYPSALVIDLRTVLGIVMQPMARGKSEEQAKQASEVMSTFDKMVGYGGQHDNSSISSTLELVLVNKDENSLKQFLNLIDLFYAMKHKGSTAYNNSMRPN
jgi:hypothetical protein